MIDQIRKSIKEANEAYRIGKPVMPDSEYDSLLEELARISPDDALLTKVGHEIADEGRKAALPIPMASMNKIKTIGEIRDWQRLKMIPGDAEVVCTPKYDGLSLCVDEVTVDAITRGDGVHGQRSTGHYALVGNHLQSGAFSYTYGEVVMPKSVFVEKYSEEFANPRNLVAGLINSKTVSAPLRDCQYIKYGAVPLQSEKSLFSTKKQILDALNEGQSVKVPYFVAPIAEITEEKLISLFREWSSEYEIDGIILEVNDLAAQESLGRETSSGNPVWARAFKHESFEQKAQSEVVGISWNISKQGLLKPTIHIRPVRLDGVTVSNVTGNNARFVKDMGIGVGAVVVVKRSGLVIPKIIDVVLKAEFAEPAIEGVEIGWNEAGIELVAMSETDDQKFKQVVSFFEILEADNVGEGVIRQLWDAGLKTVRSVLGATVSDLEGIEGFGKKKAKIVHDSIRKSTTGVPLSKLQHASGVFAGLGSKKLALLEHFEQKPTVEQVMEIEGFAEISARAYVDGYDRFARFVDGLPVTIEEKAEAAQAGGDLEGMTFVFTGIRMKAEEGVLVSMGAKIGSSVSKSTTHLVCKDPESGSSKLEKARLLGVKIIGVNELMRIISR